MATVAHKGHHGNQHHERGRQPEATPQHGGDHPARPSEDGFCGCARETESPDNTLRRLHLQQRKRRRASQHEPEAGAQRSQQQQHVADLAPAGQVEEQRDDE